MAMKRALAAVSAGCDITGLCYELCVRTAEYKCDTSFRLLRDVSETFFFGKVSLSAHK